MSGIPPTERKIRSEKWDDGAGRFNTVLGLNGEEANYSVIYCETRMAKENQLKNELEDLKYESLTISAELMEISRRSNVTRMVNEKGLDLVETTSTPIKID